MPKIVDHERYRAELIEGCRELFARQGYRALSMRAIAASLGVSTGTLYHYFPDKHSLFSQLVESTARLDVLRAEQELAGAATPAKKLAALLQHVGTHEHEFLHQIVVLLDYYHDQALQPEAGAPVWVGIQRERDAIMQLLGLRHAEHATLILSQIIGLIVLRLLEGESKPLTEQMAWAHQLMSLLVLADHEQPNTGG